VLAGRLYRPRSPADAWRAGLAYVPRERRIEGLMPGRAIFENVTLAHLGRSGLHGTWLQPRRERRFATRLGDDVRLKSNGPNQRARELSGGNQQKVVFARVLGGNPTVLLLDEPTRGVDALIRDMTAKGMAVLLVSSDLPELIGISDRIAVMRGGEITEIISAKGLGEDELINLCYGRTGRAA
jgi:ribose transport system ATP-binding protein